MSDMFYAIYSPSHKLWLTADGEYGHINDAEHFPQKNTSALEGDQRWVGPIEAGEYE